MGSNPDYLLKSFLLYIKLHKTSTSLCVAKMCDVRRMKLPTYKLREKMSLTGDIEEQNIGIFSETLLILHTF